MGQEITTTPVRIKRFLGLNTKITDTAIAINEASGLQNVNITEESLQQRLGSIKLNAVGFKDKTDTVIKPITSLYEGILGTTRFQVGTGGDAFKQLSAGAWVDRTGAVTITDDQDNHFSFTTFLDNAVADVFIGCNGINPPFKWTGAGNASVLATPPGNFKFQVVHKNKLWATVGDILYFSALRDGETWDTANDLVRFQYNGEDNEGLAVYGDNLVYFTPTSIRMVSGSSNRDLFSQTIIEGEGCASGYSIQNIVSRRYGNILIFLSNEGTFKGFNGSKNLIKLGDSAAPTFRDMQRDRYPQAVSMDYKKLNQYWLGMTFGSGTETDQVFVYDYFNDINTDPETGRVLSSILYHTGIKPNAMAIFQAAGQEIAVTGDYNGFALKQDFGLLDESATAVESLWQTGKIDFGAPNHIKLLTDLNIITTQSSTTTMALNVTTQNNAGTANLSISPSGGLWGTMLWGTGLWSAPNTKYTRCEITPNPPTSEDPIFGRYMQFQINHSDINEAMDVEELIIGVTDLGDQPEYIET